MCTHLSRRGPVYYFRRAIPENIRHHFDGKREWVFSLGTKDRALAKQAVRHHSIKTDSLLENAYALEAAALPPDDQEKAAMPIASDPLSAERARFEAQEEAERQARVQGREEHRLLLRRRLRLSTAEMAPPRCGGDGPHSGRARDCGRLSTGE